MDESHSLVAILFSPFARFLNGRVKPSAAPVAVNGDAVQTVEAAPAAPVKEENIFSEGLTAERRPGHLHEWMLKQGFRHTTMDKEEDGLIRDVIAAAGRPEHAAPPRMIGYWRPNQSHRAIIFVAREEPADVQDISVAVFEQAFKQPLHDAYRQAPPPHIGLASIVADGNWGSLEHMLRTASAPVTISRSAGKAPEARP